MRRAQHPAPGAFINNMELFHLYRYLTASALILLGMGASSCSMMTEDPEECVTEYKVRFRYDYNLKKADAFSQEVNAVTLYIIDPASGRVVWQKTDSSDAILTEGYEMTVTGLEPGDYQLMAWAGDGHINPDHFTLGFEHLRGDEQPDPSLPSDHYSLLRARINRVPTRGESDASQIHLVDVDLDRLYKDLPGEFAELRSFPAEYGTYTHTVRLMRNTNDIHIVLQHLSGKPVNPQDFKFEITAMNGVMDHDNSLMDDDILTYRPWKVKSGMAQGFVPDDLSSAQFSAAIAEFTVGRMTTDCDMVLTITRADNGDIVARVPVTDYSLLVKGHYEDMPDQEYLDRQDDYSMVFFLDDDKQWLDAFIYINSWHVVLNNTDL